METRLVDSILAVDDDASLLATLDTALGRDVSIFRCCQSVREAVKALEDWTPDLILLDVVLPDGDAFDVLAGLSEERPHPMIIAISGAATPDRSFELAKWGVHTYLSKPFGIKKLRETIERVQSQPLNLRPHIRSLVGQRTIHEVEGEIRSTMVKEAMARAKGSRRGAAKVLEISRQLLQYILRKKR
ncbi:MAG: response regulator [Proteobacteria bacterium]|nr:response regulator [Pseudomonadota bacterium]